MIWDRPENPPPWVARELGLTDWQLKQRLHKIKGDAGLGGADRVSIKGDGTVLDANGEEVGNLNDEY